MVDVPAGSQSTFQTLNVLTEAYKVKVYDSAIRKRLNLFLFGSKMARRKPLLSTNNVGAKFRFAKLHLKKPPDFWNNSIWTDETKVKMLEQNVQCHVWRQPNTTYQHKHILIPAVGTVMGKGGNLACFAATGPEGCTRKEVQHREKRLKRLEPSIKHL